MILGIDISTSITGFAVVAEGELVFYDSIDLRKYSSASFNLLRPFIIDP